MMKPYFLLCLPKVTIEKKANSNTETLQESQMFRFALDCLKTSRSHLTINFQTLKKIVSDNCDFLKVTNKKNVKSFSF